MAYNIGSSVIRWKMSNCISAVSRFFALPFTVSEILTFKHLENVENIGNGYGGGQWQWFHSMTIWTSENVSIEQFALVLTVFQILCPRKCTSRSRCKTRQDRPGSGAWSSRSQNKNWPALGCSHCWLSKWYGRSRIPHSRVVSSFAIYWFT